MEIAQDRMEIAQDRMEIAQDRMEIAQDRMEIAQDRMEIAQDRMAWRTFWWRPVLPGELRGEEKETLTCQARHRSLNFVVDSRISTVKNTT
ncbi:hypothetical protein ElyMa_006628600 [Elysia marginata]|uniref:Uncharacterized protein n=1 Tax=Elysia marginata TaxID=1093978 RepID=A0AAV4IJ25_9GAST|nr:hypothetical protein ElyMa_006628600 [Elysia marginata]